MIKYFINTQLGYGSYANIYNILYSISENVNDLEKHVSSRCIKVFKKSSRYTEYAKNEARILSKIKHPTLFVYVFDTFMYEHGFYGPYSWFSILANDAGIATEDLIKNPNLVSINNLENYTDTITNIANNIKDVH